MAECCVDSILRPRPQWYPDVGTDPAVPIWHNGDSSCAMNDGLSEQSRCSDLKLASQSPERPPRLVNALLSHCQEIGRWNSRLFSVLDNGLIYSHDRLDAAALDGESSILCNISDFDIYLINEPAILKELQPPQKHTFAIQTQPKHSGSCEAGDATHFFSTNDEEVANDFHMCVNSWKSWYEVHARVGLAIRENGGHSNPVMSRLGNEMETCCQDSIRFDRAPPRTLLSEPLTEMTSPDRCTEEVDTDFLLAQVTNKLEASLHRADTTSRPGLATLTASTLAQLADGQRSLKDGRDMFKQSSEFSPTGLLGRNYQILKKRAEDRVYEAQQTPEGPFTGGLLQSTMPDAMREEHARLAPEYNKSLVRSNTTASRRSTVISRSSTIQSQRPHRDASARRIHSPDIPIHELSSQHSLSRSGTLSGRSIKTDAISYGKLKERPQSLISVIPAIPEAPTSWRDRNGHGISAPAGMPLIGLARNSWDQERTVLSPPLSPPPIHSATPSGGLSRQSTTRTSGSSRRSHSVAESADSAREKWRSYSGTSKLGRCDESNSSQQQQQRRRHSTYKGQQQQPQQQPQQQKVREQVLAPSQPSYPSQVYGEDEDEDVPLIHFVTGRGSTR